ncbi:MAG: VTT domain-containing protein [Solobacterium sp.]|nr:VTT domain-containing protein [Solobacterium sp.]
MDPVISLLRSKNIEALTAYIRDKGRQGKGILILLQALETVSIVLPSMPVYVTAGVLYGSITGFFLCYITNYILNIIIFKAAQRMDKKTKEIFSKPKHARLEQKINEAKHPANIVILMYLIPLVPKGMIPYICANGKMSQKDFMKGLSAGSIPSILLYVLFGDAIISFDRHLFPYFIGIVSLCFIMIILNRKQLVSFLENKLN